jgi:transcriptional regulator with XRE-family HTH domain
MADLRDTVATNLRRLRRAAGWTQEELAHRVGLSVRHIGQVERGQASMSVTVLGRLALALTVDVAELVRGFERGASGPEARACAAGSKGSRPRRRLP